MSEDAAIEPFVYTDTDILDESIRSNEGDNSDGVPQ